MPRLLNNQSRQTSIYRLQWRPSFGFEFSVSSALLISGWGKRLTATGRPCTTNPAVFYWSSSTDSRATTVDSLSRGAHSECQAPGNATPQIHTLKTSTRQTDHSLCAVTFSDISPIHVAHYSHHHITTVLRPFFRDQPGEPVPEENFGTLWCKGRLIEADTPTIRLGATPSGLSSAHLHHPPIFYRPDALPAAQPTVSKHWRHLAHSD